MFYQLWNIAKVKSIIFPQIWKNSFTPSYPVLTIAIPLTSRSEKSILHLQNAAAWF